MNTPKNSFDTDSASPAAFEQLGSGARDSDDVG